MNKLIFIALLLFVVTVLADKGPTIAHPDQVGIQLGDYVPYAAVVEQWRYGVTADSPVAAPSYHAFSDRSRIITPQGECDGNLCQKLIIEENENGTFELFVTPFNETRIPIQPPTQSDCNPANSEVITAIYPNGTVTCSVCKNTPEFCGDGLHLVNLNSGCLTLNVSNTCDDPTLGQLRFIDSQETLDSLNRFDGVIVNSIALCNGTYWIPAPLNNLEVDGYACVLLSFREPEEFSWDTPPSNLATPGFNNETGQNIPYRYMASQLGTFILVAGLRLAGSDQSETIFFGQLGVGAPEGQFLQGYDEILLSLSSLTQSTPRQNAVPVEFPIILPLGNDTGSLPPTGEFNVNQLKLSQIETTSRVGCNSPVYGRLSSSLISLTANDTGSITRGGTAIEIPSGPGSGVTPITVGPLSTVFGHFDGRLYFFDNTAVANFRQICDIPFPTDETFDDDERFYFYRSGRIIRSYFAGINTTNEPETRVATTLWAHVITRNTAGDICAYSGALNTAALTATNTCPFVPINSNGDYFIRENWTLPTGIVKSWQLMGDVITSFVDTGVYADIGNGIVNIEPATYESSAAEDFLDNSATATWAQFRLAGGSECEPARFSDRFDLVRTRDLPIAYPELNYVNPTDSPSNYQGINFYSNVCSENTRTFVNGTDTAECLNALRYGLGHKSEVNANSGSCQTSTVFQ